MRTHLFLLFLLSLQRLSAQGDTTVVADYTKVMVVTNADGEVRPVTSLETTSQAGFFIHQIPEGIMKVCHPSELFIWVNGRLFDTISGCEFYDVEDFFGSSSSDTIYVSLSHKHSLEGLTCELVIFEELVVVKDEVSIPRSIRSEFREFTIIGLLVILGCLGVMISAYPSRFSYIIERAFTLKTSAYEFVNTSFLSDASLSLLAIYSLILSFVGLYLDTLLGLDFFENPQNLGGFIWSWVKLSGIVFLLFLMKWVTISIIALLFRFKGLKDFQLFDFLNINIILIIPVSLFLAIDFILNPKAETWISPSLLGVFPILLIFFIAWFSFKFVSNSSRKKLIIISYLCATEIIPAIILLGNFYE